MKELKCPKCGEVGYSVFEGQICECCECGTKMEVTDCDHEGVKQ